MKESANNPSFFSKYAKDIFVILLLTLLVYILVEQTVRFYLFGEDAFSYQKMSSIRSTGGSGNLRVSSIDKLVYELKPGLDTELKLKGFKTNSRGLRDKEYSVTNPPGTFRVAVVGGSFTMGAGVEQEDTFHSLLEDRLNRESPDIKYEFINFGVAGYTMKNKLAVLEHKVLEYDPDLVLLVLDGSQFTDKKTREFRPRAEKYSFFTSYSYKLLKKIRLFPGKDKSALNFTRQHMRRIYLLKRALIKLGNFSEQHGIPVCVVVLDHYYQHYKLGNKIERAVSKESNLFFSNTLPAFENTYFRDYTIYKVDMHPSAEANRLFADVIYRDLMRQSLLEKSDPDGAQDH